MNMFTKQNKEQNEKGLRFFYFFFFLIEITLGCFFFFCFRFNLQDSSLLLNIQLNRLVFQNVKIYKSFNKNKK